MPSSILIIGAGRLGKAVAGLWHGEIVPETLTPTTHLAFLEQGMHPRLRSEPLERGFDHVLFAVPPSAAPGNYAAEAERAAKMSRQGNLVMVSSTAVYEEENAGWVSETSAVAKSDRAKRLLEAEQVVLAHQGIVLRLAGFYDSTSGPHWVYRSQRQSYQRGDGWINLIHRFDAASLAVAALQLGKPNNVYLGCDGCPITREQLVQLTAQAEQSEERCLFSGTEGDLGKRCRNDWTRAALGWQPRWSSFESFINSPNAIPAAR